MATSKTHLRWFQFGLRSLLIVMTLACIGMSWVDVKIQKARQQKEAVAAITAAGGRICYEVSLRNAAPDWLVERLGEDFFQTAAGVVFRKRANDADLVYLADLPEVTTVNLVGTQVTDAGLERLSALPQIWGLGLDATQVSDAGLVHLGRMTQLVALSLEDTKITDAGLEHLAGLMHLRDLSLNKTKITDAGLEYLKPLIQLRRVRLSGTHVSDDGVKELRQALPRCEIWR